NQCSRLTRMGVQELPESVFKLCQNTQQDWNLYEIPIITIPLEAHMNKGLMATIQLNMPLCNF
ncbi:hypothetical protein, partial [Kistimonas scapharcae]|uniref:hypothetical protein n=1 Tax=Kistimonas scapharcae TaxID=1036133 RepID=UPI0031EB888A